MHLRAAAAVATLCALAGARSGARRRPPAHGPEGQARRRAALPRQAPGRAAPADHARHGHGRDRRRGLRDRQGRVRRLPPPRLHGRTTRSFTTADVQVSVQYPRQRDPLDAAPSRPADCDHRHQPGRAAAALRPDLLAQPAREGHRRGRRRCHPARDDAVRRRRLQGERLRARAVAAGGRLEAPGRAERPARRDARPDVVDDRALDHRRDGPAADRPAPDLGADGRHEHRASSRSAPAARSATSAPSWTPSPSPRSPTPSPTTAPRASRACPRTSAPTPTRPGSTSRPRAGSSAPAWASSATGWPTRSRR